MSTQSPYGTLEVNQRNISQCEVFNGMLSIEFKVYYSYGLARLLAPRDMMTTMMLIMHCLKNEQECIISFKNSRRRREFLNLIIHHCEFFERPQNL